MNERTDESASDKHEVSRIKHSADSMLARSGRLSPGRGTASLDLLDAERNSRTPLLLPSRTTVTNPESVLGPWIHLYKEVEDAEGVHSLFLPTVSLRKGQCFLNCLET